jgi:hypothetical protein
MESPTLTRFADSVRAFGVLIPILFLDKLFACFIILIAFFSILSHTSFIFAFVAAAIGGYCLGAGMESVRNAILIEFLPRLCRLIHIDDEWHKNIPANAVVFVYFCIPESLRLNSVCLFHSLYCRFVRLLFMLHNAMLNQRNVSVLVCSDAMWFEASATTPGKVSPSNDAWVWTQLCVSGELPVNPGQVAQVYVCSVTMKDQMTIEHWTNGHGAEITTTSVSKDRCLSTLDPEYANEHIPSVRTLRCAQKVVEALYSNYREDMASLTRRDISIVLTPPTATASSNSRDERQLIKHRNVLHADDGASADSSGGVHIVVSEPSAACHI